MYLLYVDESGSPSDPSDQYFVLAGVAVFESTTYFIENELNQIAQRFTENHRELELHGSPMRGSRGEWQPYRKLRSERENAYKDSLKIILDSQKGLLIISVILDKKAIESNPNHSGKDLTELAFKTLSENFDSFLSRENNRGPRSGAKKKQQRGLMLFDNSITEKKFQSLAREFKYNGQSRNYSEVPVFLDSKASRLIQLADLVAHAIYLKYQRNNTTFYDVIKPHMNDKYHKDIKEIVVS